MRKIRLGLYLEDQEYGERFTSCLMKHYQDRLELHLFTEEQAAVHACAGLDGMLLSGWRDAYENMLHKLPIIVLCDREEEEESREGEVFFVDKYQEVQSGASSPIRMRSRVVLPQPLGAQRTAGSARVDRKSVV